MHHEDVLNKKKSAKHIYLLPSTILSAVLGLCLTASPRLEVFSSQHDDRELFIWRKKQAVWIWRGWSGAGLPLNLTFRLPESWLCIYTRNTRAPKHFKSFTSITAETSLLQTSGARLSAWVSSFFVSFFCVSFYYLMFVALSFLYWSLSNNIWFWMP